MELVYTAGERFRIIGHTEDESYVIYQKFEDRFGHVYWSPIGGWQVTNGKVYPSDGTHIEAAPFMELIANLVGAVAPMPNGEVSQ